MIQRLLSLIILYTLLSPSGFNVQTAFAQSDPAELYDDYCADCHSIGEGDMKGPDLLGVEQKYSNDWLVRFISSAKTMINSGDPAAVKSWEKYKKKNMPNTNLSKSEIKALIVYIASFNKTVAKDNTKKTTPPGDEKTKVSESTEQSEKDIETKSGDYDDRLAALEKKIDIILEYHKKSLSARITDEEIKKGMELFEGKIPFSNEAPACVSCHNTFRIDTLNWNPSAYDIATDFSQKNNADMSDLIINPVSKKMLEVLKDHELTDDEIFYITVYLKSVERTGLLEHTKLPINLIIFISLCLIVVLALIDLQFTKIIKLKLINLIVILVSGVFISHTLYLSAANIGLSQNYAPDQPIKFSHKIHVKENKIECLFCHNSPEYSRESGIPTTNVCMICHNKIKTGVMTGQFEIRKIRKSFENKKPLEWIKVHNLPDHVFFSHAQHVSVGKIECETCHGKIEEMHITRQYSSLSMGWCVQCHRTTKVNFEENMYYSKHEELHRDIKQGTITEVTADKIGANDCQKCHY